VGPAGTGKSYLAVLAALQKLKTRECCRIILTRPAVGVENEQHGFLPGDLTSKMEPWMRPLIDVVQKHYSMKDIENMLREGVIEIAPLAFMRGRTFDQAWIVADEMQNATPNQVKMLLTRIGKDSKIVVTGDIDQTDRPGINNGLADICQRLIARPTPGISVCELTTKDVQRHPIIDQVLELYVD
jgi:phosphate starvation-inducible PhoH-like protein